MFLEYTVINDNYKNINHVLIREFNLSSRLKHKIIVNKHVLLNNFFVDTRTLIKENDKIKVDLDFEEDNSNIPSSDIKLNILYEDDALLIVNKPANLAIHPSIRHYSNNLSSGVKHYFDSINLKRKIRPVNRLDINTTGIVIFAKNEYVQESLISQMKSNIFKKEYIALVDGIIEEDNGIINAPIARKENSIIERKVCDDGQNAVTHFNVLKRYENYSLVEFLLDTGRTHQIRVHSSYLGHPILGDDMYGCKSNLINRQALHAYKVNFIHPITKEPLNIIADIPDDIKKLI